MLTSIYARNKVQERASLWHDLQILGSHIQIPWLISGDFNNVLTTKDRLGQLMTTNEVHDFKQCIDNMQLTPLKTKGCFFTWCNKQNANDRVYSKIDWAFGNFSWTQTYGHLEADFLKPGVSDQSPIVVQLWKRRTICSKPFKLYMVTIDHKDFTPMVNRVWQQQEEQDKVELIWLKLKRLKDEAKGLNKAMASYEQRPTQIRQSLECVQAALVTDPFNQLFIEQEKQNMSDLEKWSTIEEIILRQKSRATWIDYGDSNSKYFYAQLKIRANKNNITSVYNDLGIKITDPKVVEKEFTEFFTQLMGNANGLMPCPNTSIIKVGNCLTLQHQHELIMDITHEEIDEAIRDMPKDKAPGMDDFPIEFFTKQWETVKQDIYKAVSYFFHTGKMMPAWNCTVITLIPKIPAPFKVKDYRLITCCTTWYKVVAKILTRRIKKVIEVIIGKSQSAFIEGRSIIDKILFSHELFKDYNRKGLTPRCLMKVNTKKAYDSLDWQFLRCMLTDLGFPQKFIHWVMECVSTMSYSLMLSGGLTKPFQARRGIRQGDPMSPYQFVIAMEYLQRDMNQLHATKEFKYHPRCKKLGANADKSSMYITRVYQDIKASLLNLTRYTEGSIPFKYLGVPLSAKKLNIHQCLTLLEKITEKVNC
ncbi:PREDICTED: uncharacterized protein LOC109221907 [Nicotiana attenuata]|uniref:uncharacterized protein LOC109221907 n=1 Tax=Nicotiana attenuata TaxID=49451 RepID=UPI000905AAF6|nr:PREDICTED: uncharacterized protein LOC109221907 [Nicotiana attenuata]